MIFKYNRKEIFMKRFLGGFTLAETMIVIVVLGIIATLTIPALVNKNKESVAKTKVRKAMAAYESALNKMIIENDLKSHETLTAWAGANCANSTNYFKKVQGDGCIFKTSDGIWWNISNIERPLIAFKQDDLTIDKANNANDKTAFVLVGRFGNDGSLRVDDLAYETTGNNADQDSDTQVKKLYSFLGLYKASNAGGGQAVSCDDSDILCKYKRGDAFPNCSGEKRACVSYEYLNWEILYLGNGVLSEGDYYAIYDNNGNVIAAYTLGTDGNGNEYKQTETSISNGVVNEIKRALDSNGNSYIKATDENDFSGYHHITKQYKIDESGNRIQTCELIEIEGEFDYHIGDDCSEIPFG